MDEFENQFESPKPDSQSLILQRTAGLMQYIAEHYGDDAIVRMSLVAIEVAQPGEDGTHTLMAWGDDRGYVQEGFLNEIYEELDIIKAVANEGRMRGAIEEDEDD